MVVWLVKQTEKWVSDRDAADDIYKCIVLMESLQIIFSSYVHQGVTDNKSALVQIMDGCQTGDKPSSEPIAVYQWVSARKT